jgi:hypothetical protein
LHLAGLVDDEIGGIELGRALVDAASRHAGEQFRFLAAFFVDAGLLRQGECCLKDK